MKFKQLNTMLTLTSNIAVLIGIILVVIELRQNDDTLNATIQLALSNSYEEISTLVVEHPHYADSLMRGYGDPESLTPSDLINLMAVQYRQMLVLHTTWNLYNAGIIPESYWRERVSHFTIAFLESPSIKQIYDGSLHDELFSEAFIVAIDDIYQQQRAAREARGQ